MALPTFPWLGERLVVDEVDFSGLCVVGDAIETRLGDAVAGRATRTFEEDPSVFLAVLDEAHALLAAEAACVTWVQGLASDPDSTSPLLLDNVGELVGDRVETRYGVRCVLAGSKYDVGADGVGAGAHRGR